MFVLDLRWWRLTIPIDRVQAISILKAIADTFETID